MTVRAVLVAGLLCGGAAPTAAAAELPVVIYGGIDGGRHTVLNTWPLFEPGVAQGTGRSSAMFALRVGGSLRSLWWLRAELGLGVLPFESTLGKVNTALLYSADLSYLAHAFSSNLFAVDWTPVAGGGVGVYHNVHGDLGHDADTAVHGGVGLRGEYRDYGIRLSVRNYFSDWIRGEGPGINLEVSLGFELIVGKSPVQSGAATPGTPSEPEVHQAHVVHVESAGAAAASNGAAGTGGQPSGGDARQSAADSFGERRDTEVQRKREAARASIQGTVLLFAVGSSKITPEHDVLLQKVSEQLRLHRRIRLVLVGYADNLGDEARNVHISHQRALAVAQRLAQLGVDSSRLLATAAGEDSPFAANDTETGRAENRRVELHVLDEN